MGHSVAVVGETMYLFGGETGAQCTNDVWRFDLELEAWDR